MKPVNVTVFENGDMDIHIPKETLLDYYFYRFAVCDVTNEQIQVMAETQNWSEIDWLQSFTDFTDESYIEGNIDNLLSLLLKEMKPSEIQSRLASARKVEQERG